MPSKKKAGKTAPKRAASLNPDKPKPKPKKQRPPRQRRYRGGLFVHGDLSASDDKFCLLVALYGNPSRAAVEMGYARGSAHYFMALPEFQKRIAEHRKRITEEERSETLKEYRATREAIEYPLAVILNDDKQDVRARITAARTLAQMEMMITPPSAATIIALKTMLGGSGQTIQGNTSETHYFQSPKVAERERLILEGKIAVPQGESDSDPEPEPEGADNGSS